MKISCSDPRLTPTLLRKRRTQLGALCCVWLAFGILEAQGNPFSFGGDAAYFNALSSQTKNFQFAGVIGDSFWQIRIFPQGDSNELGDVEYGFVGTNQFFLEYVNTDPYPVAVNRDSIFINGSVTPRSIPASLTSFIQVYWMAFNLCMDNIHPPLTLPGKMISGDLNTNQYSIHCTISSDSKLIVSIDFMNPGVIYGMSGVHPAPPPYDKGYVAANFSIKETKQFDQRLVPAVFEWRTFTPVEQGTSSNELNTIYLVTAHIKTLGDETGQTSGIPVPPSGQKMVVRDYRLADESGDPNALYVSLNGFAAPGGKLFRSRLEQLLIIKREAISNTRIGRYLLIAILVSSAAMLFLGTEKSARTEVKTILACVLPFSDWGSMQF